jgi:hypothetical protein
MKSDDKKYCCIKCWKCPGRNKHGYRANLILEVDRNGFCGARFSCVTETVHQTRRCRSVWHRRTGKGVPNLILTSSVTMPSEVVLKHNWRTGEACVGSCTVKTTLRLLIQSNCTELQPENVLTSVPYKQKMSVRHFLTLENKVVFICTTHFNIP